LFDPVIEFLDQDLHIAVEAVVLSEQLFLEPVEQRGIECLHSLLVDYKHAPELVIDYAPALVGANRHIAELERADLLIVLVQHIVEVLLDVVQVEEDAQVAALHLQDNLVDKLINRVFILILNEVTPVENLILPLVLRAEILHELERVLLVVGNDHRVTRFEITQVLLDEDVRTHLSRHLDISELKFTHL